MNWKEIAQRTREGLRQAGSLINPHLDTLRSGIVQYFKPAPVKPTGPSTVVACDYGQSKILILEIEKTESSARLIRFQQVPRRDAGEKGAGTLRKCFEEGGYSSRRVRISVKGQGVIARFIQFPKMNPADLKSALAFEAEKYIPFKFNEVIVDYHVLDDDVALPSGAGMNLLLVAVKRDEVYPLVQTFQDAGLEIELIDIDALASLNALEYFHPETMGMPLAIFDMGSEISTLSVLCKGKPRFIRDIAYGGADVVKRLKRKLGMTAEQAAAQLLDMDRPLTPEVAVVMKEALATLMEDLKVSLDYYLDQVTHAEPVQVIFIGGGEACHPFVIEMLSQGLKVPVRAMDILGKLQIGEGVDRALLTKSQGLLPVALGLCLRDR